mgnify:CR=1 FL=1|tara:strand:- start:152 stop:328 length:177 start_codon:yes stop_codon:yes gene_type:complete
MTAIQEGPDTFKEKAVKTRWPVEKGLTAGTTTQTGRVMNLVPENSLLTRRERCGLYGR